MKVAKFGGSSLASAGQIQKVANIIMNDPEIRAVVVSAPGKRDKNDTKVTDLLIALHSNKVAGLDTSDAVRAILDRFLSIIDELEIDQGLIQTFEDTLNTILNTITDSERLEDALKSSGENFNAQVMSAYLNKLGHESTYMHPKEAGITVTDEPSNAKLLPESYDKLNKLIGRSDVVVIPGFFGVSKEGNIVTFPRGGSDITGAIVARGVHASIYENFTDLSFIYAADPGKVENPYAIKELTYREMRELAYSGFGIFHDEALQPLYAEKIPVMIRDTNNPEIEGTRIVPNRDIDPEIPVAGIACDSGFTSITLSQYLLNKTVGYTKNLLSVFEDNNISVEHIPSGVDNISVIIRSKYLENGKLEKVVEEIEERLEPEFIEVEEDLSLMVIVGEGMANNFGIANKATQAFTDGQISIRMISQGASEISMTFAVKFKDETKSIEMMYEKLFGHLTN